MNEHEYTPRRVLYLIVCGTGYAATIYDFVEQAKIRGWDPCVILTPMATRFVDVERLTQQTGHPVRSEYKRPEETDVLPRADVLMVYGATPESLPARPSRSLWKGFPPCRLPSTARSNGAMTTRYTDGSRAICRRDWLAFSSDVDEDASQLFPPLEAAHAASQLQEVLHRSPVLLGHDRHTWTLQCIAESVPWMRSLSVPGVCQLLKRLQVVSKRGRGHVHSPDLSYEQKMAAIAAACAYARQAPGEVVLLYQDEFTAYLRPLVGSSYRGKGEPGQKATEATAQKVRIAACVDAMTGRVVWRRPGSAPGWRAAGGGSRCRPAPRRAGPPGTPAAWWPSASARSRRATW